MTERIRFHFDPICPWCYVTSRWVVRLAELGAAEVDWAVFSLELANAENAELRAEKGHARSEHALRTTMVVREAAGGEGVGRFYTALGRRIHEVGEAVEDAATVTGALEDAGLDPGLADTALSGDAPWDAVVAEHRALVERTRSFGVPTIVLDGGDGPAIFGPVIDRVPNDEDAVALLEHTAWLARHEAFSELKRDRTTLPDLASVQR